MSPAGGADGGAVEGDDPATQASHRTNVLLVPPHQRTTAPPFVPLPHTLTWLIPAHHHCFPTQPGAGGESEQQTAVPELAVADSDQPLKRLGE